MRESPRRPLILKRRKLPFQSDDGGGDGQASKSTPGPASDGVCVMDHPTMADTQVVVIPKTADLQSVIEVLTAKGKERGPLGPNKFILLSGNNGSNDGVQALGATSEGKNGREERAANPLRLKNDSLLDCSLTNIQWLGKMNVSEAERKDSDKENVEAGVRLQEARPPGDGESCGVKGPHSERPPYSYMAMIQFAINSKKDKKMTLKDIYTWIEDHFPYFRDVAKPGWKNSIRHNLSLHDMFVRESTPDGKTSFWTIKPEANRCLTLEQVYKQPDLDPATRPLAQSTQQQKPVVPDVKKPSACTAERKMKPLLPRTNSYLVPIQLPLAPSIFLTSPAALPLPAAAQQSSNAAAKPGCKRLCIAPKVPKSESGSVPISAPTPETKDERVPDSGARKRKEASSSRRKQRLVPPPTEEPVLLLPDSTFFDSGLASDVSVLQEAELEAEPFKTPVKASHPASSTPSKAPEPWRITPLGQGGRSVLDFSPIRTPQRHEHGGSSLGGTPFKDLPLFGSPLAPCPQNRSLTEGLVLDTMNDSLSKILVDISFSCLEDDDFGMANLSWSQFIPELK